MTYDKELKKIKKVYGEKFMKLCRELFPDILEEEGKLFDILESSFANNSRTLYEDIQKWKRKYEFQAFVYGKFRTVGKDEKVTDKTPYELLEEAGYDLYECENEDEIQQFKKYYAKDEELCTFNGGRLNSCVVFFAVKKDVEDIRREDFKEPQREDRYGTSVMGIQFNREGLCTVSIKNRYNHKVINPDATYGNNLDNIIPGLSHSFKELLQERGLEFGKKVEQSELVLPGYVLANDGKYYKYNKEIYGVYYCPGNVIIKNNTPHNLGQKEKMIGSGTEEKVELQENKILIDYFVVDMAKKAIELYDQAVKDSFTSCMEDIEKIDITNDKEKVDGIRTITVYRKGQEHPITIKIDKSNQIIEYTNNDIRILPDNFCKYNSSLVEFNAPQLKRMGDDCFYNNRIMTEFNAPQLERMGDGCFYNNEAMTEFNAPQLKRMGDGCFTWNKTMTEFNAPKIKHIGERCFCSNKMIKCTAKKINSKQIAYLDKENELTVSDISWGARIIERMRNKVKEMFEEKDSRGDR